MNAEMKWSELDEAVDLIATNIDAGTKPADAVNQASENFGISKEDILAKFTREYDVTPEQYHDNNKGDDLWLATNDIEELETVSLDEIGDDIDITVDDFMRE